MADICPLCGGSGKTPCGTCGGSGRQPSATNPGAPCISCGGSGSQTCRRCMGSGNAPPFSDAEQAAIAKTRRLALTMFLVVAVILAAAAWFILSRP